MYNLLILSQGFLLFWEKDAHTNIFLALAICAIRLTERRFTHGFQSKIVSFLSDH